MFGSPESSLIGDGPDAPAGAMESVQPGGVGGTARGGAGPGRRSAGRSGSGCGGRVHTNQLL